jgi:hypothetical protein
MEICANSKKMLDINQFNQNGFYAITFSIRQKTKRREVRFGNIVKRGGKIARI